MIMHGDVMRQAGHSRNSWQNSVKKDTKVSACHNSISRFNTEKENQQAPE